MNGQSQDNNNDQGILYVNMYDNFIYINDNGTVIKTDVTPRKVADLTERFAVRSSNERNNFIDFIVDEQYNTLLIPHYNGTPIISDTLINSFYCAIDRINGPEDPPANGYVNDLLRSPAGALLNGSDDSNETPLNGSIGILRAVEKGNYFSSLEEARERNTGQRQQQLDGRS